MNLQASIRIPRRAKDGIDGDTGKGISEVKDFYGLSSIETSEPTEWFSYIPNKPADKYLWNYEKIIYSDGTFSETKKRVIQGKDARSIQSVVNAYAYSASETVSPTSGWRLTIASLGAKPIGYYLWVRDDITYTDGTSSSTAGYVVKDGKDGEPGSNGMPGQIPIQKEWKVGDTHRNTDEIIDYIYVRGANKNVSYYYKRATKGTTTAGAPPTGGTTPTGYLRIDWLKELAVNVLLAEEANLAGFIFKEGRLISVRGTVGGVDADYSGQDGFVPNLILDGTEGNVKITGTVNANSGSIGNFSIVDGELTANHSYMTYLPNSVYVEVTGDIQITSGGIIISNSYGGTAGHPDVVRWNIEITSVGVKVGDYEIRRDGFYQFGDRIELGAGDYIHPSTHPASMITTGTLAGIVKADNNTSYTTKQVRNMILSTNNAISSQMDNGDIWIKYE